MTTEQLPDGLQLAVKLLAQIGDDDSDRAIAAVHDLADEHAQRITLQHHAADQTQRVADLEAERDELRARLDAAAGQEPVAVIVSDYTICYVSSDPISSITDRPGLKVGSALYATPVPAQTVPEGWRLVNSGALAMVANALRRDAEEGRPVRGEMADELIAAAPEAAR